MICSFRTIFFGLFLCFVGIAFGQDFYQTELYTLQAKVDKELSLAQNNIKNYNYSQARSNLKSALTTAKSLNDKKKLGLVYSKLGETQYFLEEYNLATNTLIKAIELQRLAEDNINIAETYKILGDVYMASKKQKKALDYYNSAVTIFSQNKLKKYETESLLKQGQAFFALADYKNAENSFSKAISRARRFNFKKLLSSSLINLAEVQAKNTGLKLALKSAQEGFDIATKNNDLDVLNFGHLTLSNLYEASGNYKLANQNIRAHLKLSDSLMLLKKQTASAESKAALKANNPIIYQDQKTYDLDDKTGLSAFSQLIIVLSIALITILSLLTLSLYKNNNIRLKSNNILHKKNRELIISKEKAEMATRIKANFSSTVTHELRTPLYAITGLTNLLLEENPKPEQITHLKSLKFSGDYLLTFINDILQINKIEATKVEVENEVFNLKKKIANIISALNNTAVLNNVKIHFKFEEGLPEYYNTDHLKISQILINLVGNSIKFTKDGEIWVRIYKINDSNGFSNIRFEVEDNGIGISKEKQEHIFESFSQGSVQINRKYGGTGLGLSIVKGLVTILKGTIYLKSELGQGSTFYFDLPLELADKIKDVAPISYFKNVSNTVLNKINILLVEDNKINQLITKKILSKMKLNCDVVENGEDAVKKVKTTTYDAVLMDIHMPGISGFEATKRIRNFEKELPIFALTAITIEDKMVEFEDAGFTAIISKPFKQEELEKKLFYALKNRNLVKL